ncbi:MAG: hypothetical protein WC050_00880 [Candidatus Paceibacterota bacterium]
MHILAWTLLALALVVWSGVIYGGMVILAEAASRAESASTAEQQSDRLAYAQRLSALAVDTKAQRERLDTLTHADIVTAVNIIEAAGKDLGVSVHVSNAIPVADGSQSLPGGVQLQAIVFIVEATGSYASLTRLVSAFERLSLPSTVDQVELEYNKNADTKAVSWRLSARIRVLTTAVSS